MYERKAVASTGNTDENPVVAGNHIPVMNGLADTVIQLFFQPFSQTGLIIFGISFFSGNNPIGRNLPENGDNVFIF